MKIWKRIFMTVLLVSLLLIPSFTSFAVEGDSYNYKVTFSAGVQGTFSDGTDKMVVSDVPAGAKVFFTAWDAVSLDETSKYYVKGVRLAGRDNSEAEMAALTVTVNEDADYVVVYGIKGNQVSYTVNYLDENGNKLADSDMFYGNVGDKPVVAYKYIPGYAPKVFGMTKTLSDNEAENVFTFVYRVAMEGSDDVIYVDGDTVIVYVDKVVTIVRPQGPGGSGDNAGSGTQDDEDETHTEDTQEDGGGETQEDSQGADDTAEEKEDDGKSDEIIDLDDEEVPLGKPDRDKMPVAAIGSLIGVSVAALVALLVLLFRAKRQEKDEEK